MSDLSANCGCNDSCGCGINLGHNNFMWIILLYVLFNNGNGRNGRGNDCGCMSNIFNGNGNCENIIWLILLFALCGNNCQGCN